MRVLLAVLAVPGLAYAQVGLIEAAVAAEKAAAEMQDQIATLKLDAIRGKVADDLRTKILKQQRQFNDASIGLKDEITRLQQNPDKNKDQIVKLQAVEKQTDNAKERLKVLISVMADDETLRNAKSSGHLDRTFNEVKSSLSAVHSGMNEVSKELGSASGEPIGWLDVVAVTADRGKVRFYVGDQEVGGAGAKSVRVTGQPIVLCAMVWDEQKERLTQQQKGSSLFDPAPAGIRAGRSFSYGNANAKSSWTAQEEYTWSVDRSVKASEHVRRLGQRHFDAATDDAHGDCAEINVDSNVVQNLKLTVTGKVKWKRVSKLPGGDRSEDVVPKDGDAQATIAVTLRP